MKSAREFRSRAASFKVTAVAITGDSLIAESSYREFMHGNPMLLTNQKLKEQQEIRAREAELHQHRNVLQKFAVWFVRTTGAGNSFPTTYQAPLSIESLPLSYSTLAPGEQTALPSGLLGAITKLKAAGLDSESD